HSPRQLDHPAHIHLPRLLQIIIGLQAKPELRRRTQHMRESQRRIRTNSSLPMHNLVDATRRHTHGARQPVLAGRRSRAGAWPSRHHLVLLTEPTRPPGITTWIQKNYLSHWRRTPFPSPARVATRFTRTSRPSSATLRLCRRMTRVPVPRYRSSATTAFTWRSFVTVNAGRR